jgi:hypothetical protein
MMKFLVLHFLHLSVTSSLLAAAVFSARPEHHIPVGRETACALAEQQGHLFGILYFIGRDSAVGIAIRYGLESPGIESGWS